MKKKPEAENSEALDQIRRLLILGLTHQGVQGKKIAQVLGIDPAVVSRLLKGK